MILKIGNRPKFQCKPGQVGNKMAVQIIKKLEDIEQEDFEELVVEGEE
jgi:flagellar motor switch protein FliM